jgi:BON domain
VKGACLAAVLVLATACGGSPDDRRANDALTYTNRTSASTTVTVEPPPPDVAASGQKGAPATETTNAEVVLARRGPVAASAQPDISGRHPDRRVSERIRRVLANDDTLGDIELDRVRVVTVQGHVTLRGLVPTMADKVAIEQRVREVKGVIAVDNAIEVLR